MKNQRHSRKNRQSPGLPYLDNERGVMLVLTMVILLVLSSLAATNLINSYLERSLARNQNYASVALNAAEAGLAHALTDLNTQLLLGAAPTNADYPVDYTDPNWEADYAGQAGEGSFTATVRFLKEDLDSDGACDGGDDQDGDGIDCEVVYYNKDHGSPTAALDCDTGVDNCYHFPEAVYRQAPECTPEGNPACGAGEAETPPFPVIQIVSTGTYGGAGRRVITIETARNPLNVQAFGALTAASNINVNGNINIDGTSHDENGGAGGICGDAYPGIYVDAGRTVDVSGQSGVLDGTNPGVTDNTGTHGAAPASPDAALGMPDGWLASSQGTPTAGNPSLSADGTIIWYDEDFGITNGTTAAEAVGFEGVIIVHNPNFDPVEWDISSSVSPNYNAGAANPCLDDTSGTYGDAACVAERALKAPRSFSMGGNNTFKGVIIADQIAAITGTINIYGAVISLTTVEVNVNAAGTPQIFYSCDAINLFTGQSYNNKLGWHRRF